MDAAGNKSVTNTLASVVVVLQPTTAVISVTETTAVISFVSMAGTLYTLEYKDTLDDAEWAALPESVAGTGQLLELTDTNAPPEGRFYRVRAAFAP